MDMEEDKKLKKKKLTIIFSILFMVIILLGSTYSFFTYSKSVSAFTLTSNRIKAEFIEGTNSINITNAYPISDEFALANLDKLSYLDFTISSEVSNEDQAVTYEIYLTEDTNNTLDSNYIKVYLTDNSNIPILVNNKEFVPTIYNSLDYTSYPSDATTGKLIYKGNNTGTKSKNFRLYAWIDKDYEQNSVSQVFKFSVNIYAYNDTNKELAYVLNNSLQEHTTESCPTNIVEDGITYISGTKDCINFNYVWYSGKLWRITAIYPDGSMKMITDDEVAIISYGIDANFYTDNENKSYIYQWLNEDFLDTLYNYENIIVTDSKWNSLPTEDITTKITEGAEGVTTITSPVGLLNSYEYYMSYKNASNSNGYLNIGYMWWLLNPYDTSNVWYVVYSGDGDYFSPSYAYGGRPSINLKSEIQLSGGSGTKTDPYTIAGDKEEVTAGTTLLNTRSSGEYVKFNNELYRIVSIENNITKINKNDYVRDTSNNVLTKKFSTSVTYGGGTTDDYWDYYLNNTWYNGLDTTSKNMIVESTYYIGTNTGSEGYKKAICEIASNTVTTKDCEKTTSTWTGLVGLPRYGEMFASQQESDYSSSSDMWLINPNNTSYGWSVNNYGSTNLNGPSITRGCRPSINLKSNIKIIGGKGTKEDPFEISE